MPRDKGDGGSAFPTTKTEYVNTGRSVYKEKIEVTYDGMKLRDYFAAKAMQGMVSDLEKYPKFNDRPKPQMQIALNAYLMADAMLSAREVKKDA